MSTAFFLTSTLRSHLTDDATSTAKEIDYATRCTPSQIDDSTIDTRKQVDESSGCTTAQPVDNTKATPFKRKSEGERREKDTKMGKNAM